MVLICQQTQFKSTKWHHMHQQCVHKVESLTKHAHAQESSCKFCARYAIKSPFLKYLKSRFCPYPNPMPGL
uniref:Uncharacterized protein n=1 Tax=Arundo donax TaxID=35708 RepID=A0A0A9DSB1_ARUDO